MSVTLIEKIETLSRERVLESAVTLSAYITQSAGENTQADLPELTLSLAGMALAALSIVVNPKISKTIKITPKKGCFYGSGQVPIVVPCRSSTKQP
jgi:ABC-type phosphate transport system permease subunit